MMVEGREWVLVFHWNRWHTQYSFGERASPPQRRPHESVYLEQIYYLCPYISLIGRNTHAVLSLWIFSWLQYIWCTYAVCCHTTSRYVTMEIGSSEKSPKIATGNVLHLTKYSVTVLNRKTHPHSHTHTHRAGRAGTRSVSEQWSRVRILSEGLNLSPLW